MVNYIAQIRIGDKFDTPFGKTRGFADFASIILSNAIILAGIILLFLLVAGGIMMMAGAGQGSPEATARGRQAITTAIIGFIIIFTTYWIVQIIEVVTGVRILRPYV